MTKHDQRELQIVDVKGTLSDPPRNELVSPKTRPSRVTPADVLDGLRSMKGADGVMERIPALGDIAVWHEVAYWSVCESTGSALVHDGPLFWDLDDSSFNLQFHVVNCTVLFLGAETFAGPTGQPITPPPTLNGQVWCELDAPADGYYLFVSNLDRAFLQGTSEIEFCIDNMPLGQVTLQPGGQGRHSFLLHLPLGRHRFLIRQVTGGFFFYSVTAWNVPGPSHA
jgi:hypothetical protein